MESVKNILNSTIFQVYWSSGCCPAVERTPPNKEVVGSIPIRYWLFSLSILSNVSLNRSLEQVQQHYCFSYKNESLAAQIVAKQT